MGILTRDASAKSARGAITIIAEGNKFTGEMSVIGKMHIDGIFEGNISSLDSISIGKRGEVRGTIKAHQIDVCGLLQGEIHCDELTVEDGGKVRGTVYSEQMIVGPQGCFLGERLLKEPDPVAALEHQDDVDTPDSPALEKTLEDLPDKATLTSPVKQKN